MFVFVAASVAASGCAISSSSQRDSSAAYTSSALQWRAANGDDSSFADNASLDPASLVREVLRRNSTVEVARQSWRRALAQYPQSTSLPDPSLAVSVAPLSLLSADVGIGVAAEFMQPLPFPGKRSLRGEIAAAEAEAARATYETMRQRLALMTMTVYFELFLIERALEINAEHQTLLEELGKTILVFLQVGRSSQEEALKVEVDLAELQSERLALLATQRIGRAQLNAFLHRASDAPLGSVPAQLATPQPPAASEEALVSQAVQRRWELVGVSQKRRGAASAVALAQRERYPNFALMASYNRMWHDLEHQFMAGVSVTLPTARAARKGAEDQAEAELQRTDAERARLADEIALEVATARTQLLAASERAELYRTRVLPAAQARVDATRIGLDAGRTSFLETIRAEQDLRSARLRWLTALATAHQAQASLQRAIGLTPGLAAAEGVEP